MTHLIDEIKKIATARTNNEVSNLARFFNGKADGTTIVLPEGSLDREYNQQAFISRTLADNDIRPV